MKSQKLEIPDLSPLFAGEGQNENLDLVSIMRLFSEHLSKSVKEIKITVKYKKQKKPLEVSVTFYMIDYDRPLPMPGGGQAPTTSGNGG